MFVQQTLESNILLAKSRRFSFKSCCLFSLIPKSFLVFHSLILPSLLKLNRSSVLPSEGLCTIGEGVGDSSGIESGAGRVEALVPGGHGGGGGARPLLRTEGGGTGGGEGTARVTAMGGGGGFLLMELRGGDDGEPGRFVCLREIFIPSGGGGAVSGGGGGIVRGMGIG